MLVSYRRNFRIDKAAYFLSTAIIFRPEICVMNSIGYCMISFWITLRRFEFKPMMTKNSLDKLLSDIKLVENTLVVLPHFSGRVLMHLIF